MNQLAKKLAAGARVMSRPPRVREDQLTIVEHLEEEASKRNQATRELLEQIKAHLDPEQFRNLADVLGNSGHPSDPRTKEQFFRTCLQLQAWELFPSDVGYMGHRLGNMFRYLVRNPGELTQAYLSRVAECYVRDMPTEFAVMARAALDSAIQEILSDEAVSIEVGTRHGRIDLERRIEACISKGWLSNAQGRAAHKIREVGRDAAHFTPGLTADMDELLEALASLLRRTDECRAGAV
jgi:hypothetical protein